MNSVDALCGRGRRLSAAILDFLIVAAVAFVAIWPLGLFEHQQAYEQVQLVSRLLGLMIGSYLLVNSWFLLNSGQTLGKRILGIQIVARSDNKLLPLWKLLFRAFSVLLIVVISIVVNPIIGLLVIVDILFIFTVQRCCLHDYLVGSAVQNIASGSVP